MVPPHAQEFIDALHRLEEQHDLDGMVALFNDDSEASNPTDASPHRGLEGARQFWDGYRHSFEEIHSEFRNIVATDEVTILEWTSRGKAVEGAPVEYDGVSVVEYQGGKVKRFRAYFDPSALQA
jgi:ketosteroid isomerase-like protein